MALEAVREKEEARERAEWIRMAWFTAILLAPHNDGKMLDPDDLLPDAFRKQEKELTQEEARRELEELKKRLGVE